MSKIKTSLHGKKVGLTYTDKLLCPQGFVSGDEGNQFLLPSPNTVTMFDDFLGSAASTAWTYTEGTDTTTANGAVSAAVNGVFLLTGGDSAGTVAADGAQLNSLLQWKASSGSLVFQTRVKLASIASVSCFFGFTDTTSLEQPIESASSADTLTTTATDAVGFMFDTNMSTDHWWFAGVANDVDATAKDTGFAPVADTYETFRIEVDTSGNAVGYRNGLPVASTKLSGAVTASVALTPVFIVRPLSAAAGKTLSVDYIAVSSDRV